MKTYDILVINPRRDMRPLLRYEAGEFWANRLPYKGRPGAIAAAQNATSWADAAQVFESAACFDGVISGEVIATYVPDSLGRAIPGKAEIIRRDSTGSAVFQLSKA